MIGRWFVYFCLIMLILSFIVGCSAAPRSTIATNATTFIPALTAIQKPPAPNLTGFELDVPRDMSKQVPKNTTECLKIPEADRNVAYWRICGTHPVDPNSNLVAGFDEENLEKFTATMAELNAYIQQLNDRIDAANKERDFWTAKSLEEEKRGMEQRRELLERVGLQ